MERGFHHGLILFTATLFSISLSATSAFAWNQSFHALAAKKAMGLDHRHIASYNARMGALVPDFFWYLRYKGLIDADLAGQLHGETSTNHVLPETAAFYHSASGLLGPWDFRLRYFTEGIAMHVYADITAHDPDVGYVEGRNGWIAVLADLAGLDGAEDREAIHLALEFAVDALLIDKYGFQINDLLFAKSQGAFVEEAVAAALGYTPGFDVSREFEEYLDLMRAVEEVAALYGPFLKQGGAAEETVNTLLLGELQDPRVGISREGSDTYYDSLLILLFYPSEIRETITLEGMHWERHALESVIEFCRDPDSGR